MKKSPLIVTLLFVALTTNALAGGQGAIKVPFDPAVGWVILNTTASGKINASAHVEDGLPNEEFSVSVRVRHEDGSTEIFADIATLSTNGQGRAMSKFKWTSIPRQDPKPFAVSPFGSEKNRIHYIWRLPGISLSSKPKWPLQPNNPNVCDHCTYQTGRQVVFEESVGLIGSLFDVQTSDRSKVVWKEK